MLNIDKTFSTSSSSSVLMMVGISLLIVGKEIEKMKSFFLSMTFPVFPSFNIYRYIK